MRRKLSLLFAAAASLAVSACVTSDLERAGLGAAIGAGTAVVLDVNPVTGAVLGGAGGALCDDIGLC